MTIDLEREEFEAWWWTDNSTIGSTDDLERNTDYEYEDGNDYQWDETRLAFYAWLASAARYGGKS